MTGILCRAGGLVPAFLVLCLIAGPAVQASPGFDDSCLDRAVAQARSLERLNSLIVARDGEVVVAEAFRGRGLGTPVNVKSVSKSIVAALIGIAIDRGILEGPDQTIGALLDTRIPDEADPRVRDITLGNLLSMQAGLERTSGRNYGRWVQSPD